MSGPQRHGPRRSAAACCFVLLVLAFALVRGAAASAHGASPQHPKHPAAGGLLGGLGNVVSKVGHSVDGLLTGVGSVLGDHPHATRTPTPTPTPTPTKTKTPPSTTASGPTNSRPSASVTSHHSAQNSGGHSSVPAGRSVPLGSHRTHRASPVAATSSAAPTPSASHTRHVAAAFDSPGPEIPGLDVTTSLAALMIAMVLGVGLIVYRAGYRGERAR